MIPRPALEERPPNRQLFGTGNSRWAILVQMSLQSGNERSRLTMASAGVTGLEFAQSPDPETETNAALHPFCSSGSIQGIMR